MSCRTGLSRYAKVTCSKATAPSTSPSATGRLRLGHRRRLLDDARQLLQRRARRLERVVELREVLHRFEELPQIEDEAVSTPRVSWPVHDEVAAVHQHEGGGEPPEQDDPGPKVEPGGSDQMLASR